MSDILLGYDIDYALSYELQQTLLKEHNILPVEKQELCMVLFSGSEENKNKINFFINLFQNPIKLLIVDCFALQKELHNLPFKIELHKLAQSALDHIHKENENSYIIQFMDRLFEYCIRHNASDIHFETLDKSVVIRLRIDGELTQVFRFSIALYPLLSSIIKYFGNLDIAQRRIPLNGRFTVAIENKDYDMRISTLPTVHGESIVLRILDNGNIQKDLETIGFDQRTLGIIKKSIRLTQGLVLVTGPTGSGKCGVVYKKLARYLLLFLV